MPKKAPETPLQSLFDRNEGLLKRTTEITGLSPHTIKKARLRKAPKGWEAFAIEVDRLHRIGREVDKGYIALLEAKIAELEEKLK